MNISGRDALGFTASLSVLQTGSRRSKSVQPRRRAGALLQARAYRPRWAMCSPNFSDSAGSVEQPQTDIMPDMLYDELVSDEDFVVIDGKDVGMLIEELRANGLDDIGSSMDHVGDSVLSAAERVADAKVEPDATASGGVPSDSDDVVSAFREAPTSGVESGRQDSDRVAPAPRGSPGVLGDVEEQTMQYFTDENLPLMPSWARAAFLKGSHQELEVGASRIGQGRGTGRLEAIVTASKVSDISDLKPTTLVAEPEKVESKPTAQPRDEGVAKDEFNADGSVRVSAADAVGVDEEDWVGAGILDCSVADVAVDYNIPLEMVSDIMVVYGVRLPIKRHDDIRERMTSEEIERMLELITSFDAMDLSDRYSDHTINDLAEDYDVDVDSILYACEMEGVFLISGKDTRLQLSREDRILDIARGRATSGGHEYPSLLHGLVVGDNPLPSSTFVQS